MKKINFKYIVALLLIGAVSCVDLEVENLNAPDKARVQSSPGDIVGLVGGGYQVFYRQSHRYGMGMPLNTAADNITCSWGNAAMRDQSWEPRKAWDNAPNYGSEFVTRRHFNGMYSALGGANDALIALANPELDFGDDEAKVRAFAKFVQGISLGYLGLLYDKAYVVTELTTPEFKAAPEFSDYNGMRDAAIASLDEAIAACSESFVIPSSWLAGNEMDNSEFKQVISSYAARILAYSPRNATENAAVNWAAVKSYASAGITSDFEIVGDGANQWYPGTLDYNLYQGWGRTDMRLVNMMDPDQPARWDDTPSFPHPPESGAAKPGVDLRLYSDFDYQSSNWFRTERGYYHFSNYRMSRYDWYLGSYFGNISEIMLAENDMLMAEAELEMGNTAAAAAIVNAGTRTTRGGLPNVSTAAEVSAAIHRERQIEMMVTGLGIQFFDMRKRDMLQFGSNLHFPIPATILEVLGEEKPFYTFGGPDNADGVNTSTGGWF